MKEEPNIGDLKIVSTWDVIRADYEYKLLKFHKYSTFYLDPTNNKNEPSWNVIAKSDNTEWAERTADHYHLEIEYGEELNLAAQ